MMLKTMHISYENLNGDLRVMQNPGFAYLHFDRHSRIAASWKEA